MAQSGNWCQIKLSSCNNTGVDKQPVYCVPRYNPTQAPSPLLAQSAALASQQSLTLGGPGCVSQSDLIIMLRCDADGDNENVDNTFPPRCDHLPV